MSKTKHMRKNQGFSKINFNDNAMIRTFSILEKITIDIFFLII